MDQGPEPGGVLGGFSYFQGGDLTLPLTFPADHSYVRVEFDFYAIDLWNADSNFNVSLGSDVRVGGSKTVGPFFTGTTGTHCR